MAIDNYQAGQFELALTQFSRIVEDDEDDYEAVIGLANACREVGNDRYLRATTLANAGRYDVAREAALEGHQMHTTSLGWFERAKLMRPNDARPIYGEGLLYYSRASGAYRLFAQDEDAEIVACAEGAVQNFEQAAEKMADSAMTHRYLGLMLVVVARFEDAIPHLERYADALRERMQTITTWNAPEEMRAERDREIQSMEDEMDDLQASISMCRQAAVEPQSPGAPPINGVTNSSFRRLIESDMPGGEAEPAPNAVRPN